jgi:1,4-dihydroxy-6-naphthoate synthase
MIIRIGYSPCPNDTFIFDGLAHGKIDTEGLQFDVVLADVEALNRMAFAGELEATKLSYHAFAHLTEHYKLLDAGSALGNNCGPLLVSRPGHTLHDNDRIAIPGRMTTANFLLGLAYPHLRNKEEVLFSDIENAVVDGRADAGLIIHENRFTYEQKGLVKIRDLGEFWESSTGLPIPLGGIVARRDLGMDTIRKINRVMRRSVEYGFEHTADVMPYVCAHAQAMDPAVMQQHIDLYVTDFTRNLGEKGRAAVAGMFEMAYEKHLIPAYEKDFFID